MEIGRWQGAAVILGLLQVLLFHLASVNCLQPEPASPSATEGFSQMASGDCGDQNRTSFVSSEGVAQVALKALIPSLDSPLAPSPVYSPSQEATQVARVEECLALEDSTALGIISKRGFGDSSFLQLVTKPLEAPLSADLPQSPKPPMARRKKVFAHSPTPPRSSDRLKLKNTQGKSSMQLATEVLAKKLGPSSSFGDKDALFNSYVQMFDRPLERQTMLAIADLVEKGQQQQMVRARAVLQADRAPIQQA